uniref:Uncharacterized protein n=1 Tax=Arundo donax TaxID=35708 RepID=A0A0A9AUK7_ARUDO
MRNTQTAIIN